MTFAVYGCLLVWLIILCLPWRPWSTDESLVTGNDVDKQYPKLTVLIPARNEEALILNTIDGVREQLPEINIVVIDDHSTDKTVERVTQLDGDNIQLIHSQDLPSGWTGKLWALHQGLQVVQTEYILLLDADIYLKPGTLAALFDKQTEASYDMVSVMAYLRMQNVWERLFMPAFIYFFKLLYPFSLSNSSNQYVAAAAGGCVLLNTEKLRAIGGFEQIKEAIIDDCALARAIKSAGGKTWVGLTHDAVSQRASGALSDIWHMVTRTAFCQLKYSYSLLVFCTVLMALLFIVPLLGLFSGLSAVTTVSLFALVIMVLTYVPVINYYNQPKILALTLPLVAATYLLMTWHSALRASCGVKSSWKGRDYHYE